MEKVVEGLMVSITGMSVVFFVLITISILIYFLRFLNYKPAKKTELIKKADVTKNITSNNGEISEHELVAVISAAISVMFKGRAFRICGIVEENQEDLNQQYKDFNMWSKFGRMNVMTTHANFGKGRLKGWKS